MKIKKILTYYIIAAFINMACFSSGYAYARPYNITPGSTQKMQTANVFNLLAFITKKTTIDLTSAGRAGELIVSIKKEANIKKNINTLFKSSGKLILDFGSIGKFFVKSDNSNNNNGNKNEPAVSHENHTQTSLSQGKDTVCIKKEKYMLSDKKIWKAKRKRFSSSKFDNSFFNTKVNRQNSNLKISAKILNTRHRSIKNKKQRAFNKSNTESDKDGYAHIINIPVLMGISNFFCYNKRLSFTKSGTRRFFLARICCGIFFPMQTGIICQMQS